MNRPWSADVARLTALLTFAGLATTRLGLVLHEVAGHGGVVLALGGDITDVRLYAFAGGWLTHDFAFQRPWEGVAVALGGIAVQLVLGLAAWLALARRSSLAALVVRGCGLALVIHGAWYLATGTWHGYGDGRRLHAVLGDDRWLVAVPAAAIMVAFTFLGARAVLGPLAASIVGTHTRRVVGTILAIAVGGGLQVGLAVAELRVRAEDRYSAGMQTARDRQAARDLERWELEQARTGNPASPQARAAHERELAKRPHEAPFAHVLAMLTLVAMALGAWRARSASGDRIPDRVLARAAIAAAAAIAATVVLDVVVL